MAFLRTLDILGEINMLFEESDFELRTNKKLRKQNKDKLQICSNINGTVTVIAPRGKDRTVYMTFDGSGSVELWPNKEIFKIDTEAIPEENRKRFRSMLTSDYGLEFCNGGHQVYPVNMNLQMLPRARIIPQIFKVFNAEDFYLRMHTSNLPSSHNTDRIAGGILPDGSVSFRIGIENLESLYSDATYLYVTFDGSDNVRIGASYSQETCDLVAVCDARHILIEQYGVSFNREWRMNSYYSITL